METKSLKEITNNVFSKVRQRDICLPSHYLSAFKDEIADSVDDIEELVSIEVSRDIDKSQKILNNLENILYDTVTSLEGKREVIPKCIKEELDNLVERINSLSAELHFDELTAVHNRRWLFKQFLDEKEKFKESGTIAFIDLNDFKEINDSHGHVTGDKALTFLTSFIKTSLSKKMQISDFHIVRFAGDEFIVLFSENIEDSEARKIMEKLAKSISSKKLKPTTGEIRKTFKLSFSYGIVHFNGGEEFYKCIERADKDMYLMKKMRKEQRD